MKSATRFRPWPWTLAGVLLVPLALALASQILVWLAGSVNLSAVSLVPRPLGVARALLALPADVEFWRHAGATLLTVAEAIGLALLFGVPVGALLSCHSGVWRLAAPSLDLVRSIPVTFFVPPLAAVWGLKHAGLTVTLAAVPCAIFLVLGLRQGVLRHEPDRVHAFRFYLGRRSALLQFRHVLWPETAADVVHALRLGLSYALVIVTVLSYFNVGPTVGLGLLINQRQDSFQIESVTAITLIVGTCGYALNWLLGEVQGRLQPELRQRRQ